MRPDTAASWLPRSVTEASARTRSQQGLGLAPYPTTSPRQITRSTALRRIAASTSTSASRLPWMSLKIPIRIAPAHAFRPGWQAERSGILIAPRRAGQPWDEQVELELVEVRQLAELRETSADLLVGERLQALQRELLDR